MQARARPPQEKHRVSGYGNDQTADADAEGTEDKHVRCGVPCADASDTRQHWRAAARKKRSGQMLVACDAAAWDPRARRQASSTANWAKGQKVLGQTPRP
ncbi:unnamed protein product [Prorocentrum cordatum]|uniref:Uncharacterized protein n=1 Tax=Prorocentrum cordatum TaxID=2364126 RepID=A0ABN9QW42_9DINO|nr:unnamed protein product [Polarella glacialis]